MIFWLKAYIFPRSYSQSNSKMAFERNHFKTQVRTVYDSQREILPINHHPLKWWKKSAFPTADWPSDIFQIDPIYMRARFSSRVRSRLAPKWGWWIVPALANRGAPGRGHLLKIHPIRGSNCLLSFHTVLCDDILYLCPLTVNEHFGSFAFLFKIIV